MLNHKAITGAWGEELAASWLQKNGFSILCRNWRKGSYELDLVCACAGELVFVEVKTRAKHTLESGREALSEAKQKSLRRAAQEYIKQHQAWNLVCRFDLVCIECSENTHTLEHLVNVFEFSKNSAKGQRQAMPCCNTNWQPW